MEPALTLMDWMFLFCIFGFGFLAGQIFENRRLQASVTKIVARYQKPGKRQPTVWVRPGLKKALIDLDQEPFRAPDNVEIP